MLYNSSVILFNENKYGEIVLQNVVNELYKYTSFDGKEWICRLCHIALSRNNVPIQAKANGLDLDAIPRIALNIAENSFYENGCITHW